MLSKDELLKKSQRLSKEQLMSKARTTVTTAVPKPVIKPKEELIAKSRAKRHVTQDDVKLVNSFYDSATALVKEYETDIKTLGWGNATTISDKYSNELLPKP